VLGCEAWWEPETGTGSHDVHRNSGAISSGLGSSRAAVSLMMANDPDGSISLAFSCGLLPRPAASGTRTCLTLRRDVRVSIHQLKLGSKYAEHGRTMIYRSKHCFWDKPDQLQHVPTCKYRRGPVPGIAVLRGRQAWLGAAERAPSQTDETQKTFNS
jgi:hypothetical protein